MLTLLWGRAGSGKTTRIVNEICGRATRGENGLIWLVPEPFSHECERLLAKMGGPAVCLNAEVMTFGRIIDRVLYPYGSGAQGVLDEGGRLLTMRLAVDSVRENLSFFARSAHKGAFLTALSKTVSECKCYAISPGVLNAAAENTSGPTAVKLRELALIFAAYDSFLSGISLDPRDRMTLLAESLRSGDYARDKSLYVDSFVTFTPQEREVLTAFIEQGRDVTAAFTGEPESDNFLITRRTAATLAASADKTAQTVLRGSPRYKSAELAHIERHFFDIKAPVIKSSGGVRAVSACSVTGECDHIARSIRELTGSGYRYRDIVVVVSDMARYGPQLEQTFEREGIPVFVDNMDEVMLKPLCRFLKASADVVTHGWRTKDVMALLDTGLFRSPRTRIDRFEGYIKRWKPEGGSWREDWKMHPRGYEGEWTAGDIHRLEIFNRMRLLVYAPLSHLKDGRMAKGWTDALLTYIRRSRLQTSLSRRMKALRARGELKAAEECAQLWDILLNAMSQCAGILGDTPMGLDVYMELLLLVLSGAKVGSIPVALDRVSVGELGRLRKFAAKVVFVPGCDAAHMPSLRMPESLLSVEERVALESLELELPPDGEDRLIRENFNIYSAFALPSQKLFLSFTRETGGEELPADALKLACGLLDIEVEPLPPFVRAWTPPGDLRAPLSREAVKSLYGTDIRLSATRLERALECGFAFFCRYGLKANPDAEPGYSPLDAGLFIHEILEKTGRRVHEAGGAKEVTPESVRAWAREYAEDYIKRVLRGIDEYGPRFRRRFEALAAFGADIAENVNAELAMSEFSPMAFELRFGGKDEGGLPALRLQAPPGGFGFLLEGKIDRADVWRSPDGVLFVRVVDYKTGSREFSLSELFYGKGLQLPLYLFALTQNADGLEKASPAGMLYLPAKRPLLPPAAVRQAEEEERIGLSKALRREGLLLADEAVLRAMGATASAPSPFLPAEWKNGVLSPKSTVSPYQLDLLSKHIDKLVSEAASALVEGDVSASPLSGSSSYSSCTWCDYAKCCYFNKTNDTAREMKITDSHFWESIKCDN